MNNVRKSDLMLPLEVAPPPIQAGIPNDDELDAMCDRMMRIDIDHDLFEGASSDWRAVGLTIKPSMLEGD